MSKKINCGSYNVYINDYNILSTWIASYEPSSLVVIVDQNTEVHCLPFLLEILNREFETITIPEGEIHKNLDTCQYVWTKMQALKLDRKALVINLGGGVVGDLGGFCASTYLRGIAFVQMPTTLLAQVDASVGGKLGVDFQQKKNVIGCFENPQAVFVYTAFLQTLPYRQMMNGFAEVLKHSLLADKKSWKSLTKEVDFRTLDFEKIISKSIKIKQNIVQEDPKEKALRKLLNLGHTIGHAIESQTLDSIYPLLHGEAVAIGLICESHIAMQKNLLKPATFQKIKKRMLSLYGHKYKSINIDAILDLVAYDKKNTNKKLLFSLLTKVGAAKYDIEVSLEEIKKALEDYVAPVPSIKKMQRS